jgi:hypothetical protein
MEKSIKRPLNQSVVQNMSLSENVFIATTNILTATSYSFQVVRVSCSTYTCKPQKYFWKSFAADGPPKKGMHHDLISIRSGFHV